MWIYNWENWRGKPDPIEPPNVGINKTLLFITIIIVINIKLNFKLLLLF